MLWLVFCCAFGFLQVHGDNTEEVNQSILKNLIGFVYQASYDPKLQDGLDLGPFNISLPINTAAGNLKLNASIDGTLTVSDIAKRNSDLPPDNRTRFEGHIGCFNFTGKYSLDGLALLILPLEGNGNFSIIYNNLNVTLATTAVPIGGIVEIDYLNVTYDGTDLKVHITGLGEQTDLQELLTPFIEDLVGSIVIKFREQIQSQLASLVMSQTTYGKLDLNSLLIGVKHLL